VVPDFDLAFHGGEPLLLFRLFLATLVGGMIGWNRFRAGKPAGVGTYALVALGAAFFVAIPILTNSLDALSRVIQGITAGIGFLGAGEIFRDRGERRVRGLTSAAALWATAALGIIAVCGSVALVAAATLIVLLVLVIAPRCERRFPPRVDNSPY